MSWVDIAVLGQKRGVVILDYAPGWADFIDELHFADVFEGDEPDHLSPGAYRWSGYKVGSWEEGDAAVATGGTFTPYRTTHEPRPAGDLREALEDLSRWFQSIRDCAWDEIVADGGVTAWMVIQQEARTVQLPRVYRALATHSPAPMAGEGEARLILRALRTRMATACDWTRAGNDHVKVRTADWHVLMEIGERAKDYLAAHPSTQEG